ncbi:hypothetical protein FRB90_011040, partial [Tulasnella sp. 427]
MTIWDEENIDLEEHFNMAVASTCVPNIDPPSPFLHYNENPFDLLPTELVATIFSLYPVADSRWPIEAHLAPGILAR